MKYIDRKYIVLATSRIILYLRVDIPEVIIFSTQRSGTHLLESFLDAHPQICVHGELFLDFKRSGKIPVMDKKKTNAGILMYSQLGVFVKLTEKIRDTKQIKMIHLLRNAGEVALSRMKMGHGRQVLGENYKTHFFTEDQETVNRLRQQSAPADPEQLADLTAKILREQQRFSALLRDQAHLEVHYSALVPNQKDTRELDEVIQSRLLEFIGLPQLPYALYTDLIKTG